MAELEEVLREVVRNILGFPVGAKNSVPSLRKALGELPQNSKETLAASLILDRCSVKSTSQETTASEAVEVEPKTPSARPDGGAQKPVAHEGELLRRLQEIEKKLQKKVNEAEKLRAKLEKEQKARQLAESAKGRAEQEAAHLRKTLSRVAEEKDCLSAELKKVRAENAKFLTDEAMLEQRVKSYEMRLDDLETKVRELVCIEEQKKLLEDQFAKLSGFKEALPEPFPLEALLRVLVLDYPSLAGKAEERVIALIEGYRAFLKRENHPTFLHSNLELLVGEPEGIVLLGLEKLLLDLDSLPLTRWLRTHAFRLEALLQEGQQLSSPRLREE